MIRANEYKDAFPHDIRPDTFFRDRGQLRNGFERDR